MGTVDCFGGIPILTRFGQHFFELAVEHRPIQVQTLIHSAKLLHPEVGGLSQAQRGRDGPE